MYIDVFVDYFLSSCCSTKSKLICRYSPVSDRWEMMEGRLSVVRGPVSVSRVKREEGEFELL